jgi:hypothetical protein
MRQVTRTLTPAEGGRLVSHLVKRPGSLCLSYGPRFAGSRLQTHGPVGGEFPNLLCQHS